MEIDLWLDLVYEIKTGRPIIINTNIKDECLDEVVSEWLQGSIGRGVDKSPAEEKERYRIRMGVDLSYDEFSVRADTGNKSLTTGILANSLGKWVKASSLGQDEAEDLAYYLGDNKYSPQPQPAEVPAGR